VICPFFTAWHSIRTVFGRGHTKAGCAPNAAPTLAISLRGDVGRQKQPYRSPFSDALMTAATALCDSQPLATCRAIESRSYSVKMRLILPSLASYVQRMGNSHFLPWNVPRMVCSKTALSPDARIPTPDSS